MSWAAAATGVMALLQYTSSQQQQQAQRSANQQNRAMSAEELAQQKEQYGQTRLDQQYEADKAREMALYAAGEGERMMSLRSGSRRAREDELNIAQQQRFGALRRENLTRLDPFSQAGISAQKEQMALLGLGAPGSQEAAFAKMSESPGQKFLRERQERSTLRNAAAMGGLRGGRVRTALQEQAFGRAQTDMERQIERLGAVSNRGLSAGRTAAGMRGPSYIQTGRDVGVVSGTDLGLNPYASDLERQTYAPTAADPNDPNVTDPSDVEYIPSDIGGGNVYTDPWRYGGGGGDEGRGEVGGGYGDDDDSGADYR